MLAEHVARVSFLSRVVVALLEPDRPARFFALKHALIRILVCRGLLLRSQSAAGVVMNASYDLLGRKTQQVDGIGGTLAWSYDYFGRVKTHTDLSGLVFTSSYDANSGQQATLTASGASDRSNALKRRLPP